MKLFIIIAIIILPFITNAGFNTQSFSNTGTESFRSEEKIIIAKVADKEITLQDFIQRAEYSLRAPYCKGNTNNDKNIILNTLIAEKLLSLDTLNCELLSNEKFISFIAGRREQKMREVLYYIEGENKVMLDNSEIKRIFSIAGRTYNIQYYNISDKTSANIYLEKFAEKDSSFDIYFNVYGKADSIREKNISWNSPELSVIHKSLFSNALKKDQVIGPLYIDDTTNLLIKIKGWNNRVVISEKDIQDRYDEVVKKLNSDKADSIYNSFILKLMSDKTINFNTDNLNKIVEILAPHYLNLKKETNNEYLDLAYDQNLEVQGIFEQPEYLNIAGLPIFEIDEKTWTIAGLKTEIDKHPLVFRRSNKNGRFADQLRLAIVDLVRDIYITRAAYEHGLDKNEIVRHYEQSWFDASIALFQRDKYLLNFDIDQNKPLNVFEQYLNPYIKALFKKYSDQIQINVPEYNNIVLTKIDMFTTQSDVPYPIYVPAFPQLTTYNRLDYGTKMGKSE